MIFNNEIIQDKFVCLYLCYNCCWLTVIIPIKCSSLDVNQLWLTVIIPSTILPLLGTRLSKNKSVSTFIVEGRLMTQQNGSFSINDSASPRSLISQMTHFTSTLIILIKCSQLTVIIRLIVVR